MFSVFPGQYVQPSEDPLRVKKTPAETVFSERRSIRSKIKCLDHIICHRAAALKTLFLLRSQCTKAGVISKSGGTPFSLDKLYDLTYSHRLIFCGIILPSET